MTVTRVAAGALLALATCLALAAPASADTETVADPRGDTVNPDLGARGLNPPPAKRADVVRTVAEHEQRRVTLRLRVADLGPGAYAIQGRVRTDEATYTLVANRNGGALETFVSQDDVGIVPCEDYQVLFRPQQDTIVLSAPRTCLSLPTWVQTGAKVTASEDAVVRADDARRNGDGGAPVRIGQRRLRHN